MAGVARGDHFVVITPFAGIPTDDIGHNKHTLLHAEHEQACQFLKAGLINGDFLDDVYPPCYPYELAMWLLEICKRFDEVWIPLGIRHPDHVMLNHAARIVVPHSRDELEDLYDEGATAPRLAFYEELPYRENYPGLAHERLKLMHELYNLELLPKPLGHLPEKKDALQAYQSQITRKDGNYAEDLLEKLYAQERVWKVIP